MPHILVIESDPALRVLMRAVLERIGHRVAEAADAAAGLALYDAARFDVVICDEDAESPNGTWLLTALRVRQPDVRVLLLTAGGAPHALAGDRQTGFLPKTFTIDALERAVGALAGWRL